MRPLPDPSERSTRLLAALDEHTGLTVDEAADLLGLAPRHVAALLVRLGAAGLAVPEGRRWFAATDPAGCREIAD